MDSLIMVDKHLDTIPKTKSDKFIKSSVENLVQNLSESEDASDGVCDLPVCDDFPKRSSVRFLTSSSISMMICSSSDDPSHFEEEVPIGGCSSQPFGILFVVNRSGLAYCSGGLSGKYTVLAGKENGVSILKSIDEVPFQMGTFRETLAEGNEGALHLVQNVQGRQNRGQGNNPRGAGAADKMLLLQASENSVVLDEEQLLFLAGGHDTAVNEDLDESPFQDLALNVDNVFQADECDAFDSDVDEAPTAQTKFMANLSSADPIYDEASPSYDSDILSEDVLTMKAEALKEQTSASRPIKALTVYPPNTPATLCPRIYTRSTEGKGILNNQGLLSHRRKYDEIKRKNLLIANDNLIVDCLSKEVFYIATNPELTVSKFTEMHDAHTLVQARCIELKAKLSKLHDKVQKDDHTELVKCFSNLENLKRQKREDLNAITMDSVKTKSSLHLESVETLREIVEEAKVERPLDRSLTSACVYTKHS
ncbi:hypothetical protein Tco_1439813 [Tanacetum coccineum]